MSIDKMIKVKTGLPLFAVDVHAAVHHGTGAGTLEHLYDVFRNGGAHAVLAASIFHFGTYTVPQAKQFLAARGIPVRSLTE